MSEKIKVIVPKDFRETTAGPSTFMSRLVTAFHRAGKIEITDDRPHIALGIMTRYKHPGCKHIVRIDGCYYNKCGIGLGMNNQIAESIRRADAVIYQSSFSRKLCHKILRVKPVRYTVIPNGIDLDWVNSIPAQQFREKHVFVAAAKWRNSKRPKSIINGFIKAKIPSSKLIMIGKYKMKGMNDPRIQLVGNLKAQDVISHMKGATALIHLCKIESCPNAVIEALACGKPIVCNNIGGTPELVKSDGIVVETDKEFRFKFIKEKDLDTVNSRIVADGLNKCIQSDWNITRPDLDINFVAEQYYQFFASVLNNNV